MIVKLANYFILSDIPDAKEFGCVGTNGKKSKINFKSPYF